MRPRLATDNASNLRLGNAKHIRDGLLGEISAGVKSPRFAHHVVSELPAASPLVDHIGVIVTMRPNKQVAGIAASGAVALMADNAALRKSHPGKNQRCPAGRNLVRTHSEYAIPVFPLRSEPRPTSVRSAALVNLRPKPVSVRRGVEAAPLMPAQKPRCRSLNSAHRGSIAFPDICLASASALAISFRYVSHVANSATLDARGDN